MVTSKEIMASTGLSSKTLTRWHQRGMIPKPAIKTHPNGRGKIAYWPDWVLDRCKRLVELREKHGDLKTAWLMLEAERVRALDERAANRSISDVLNQKSVKTDDGESTTLLSVFTIWVMDAVEQSILDRDWYPAIAQQLDDKALTGQAVDLFQAGYNAVLTFDGVDARIEPDFLVSHFRDRGGQTFSPFLVVPLWTVYRKFMSHYTAKNLVPSPKAKPAPKVWANEGNVMTEYQVCFAGELGFELIRESAEVVGYLRDKDPDDEENE